jgi:penicillin V acylase-like amidase (Ntn superfamily)
VCTMMMKRDLLVAAKTVDTPKTLLTFDQKSRNVNSYGFLYFKMGWQNGVNSGINEEGLAVLSSYAGTKLPQSKNQDTRGMANELALSQCRTVQEGLHTLEKFFKEQPSGVGGTHFLMDADGGIAVLEHEPHLNTKRQIIKTDYLIRANEPLLMQAEKKNFIECEDRRLRYAQAEMGIKKISGATWLEEMKKLLSAHLPKYFRQIGALCIHDFENKGSRSKDLSIHSTETALIFDIKNRRLIYSEGPPCHNQWAALTFKY